MALPRSASQLAFLALPGSVWTPPLPAQEQPLAAQLQLWCESEVPGLLGRAGEPGLAVVLIEDADVAYCAGFGSTTWEGESITPETIFNVGSISKTLTAWAVMTLVESKTLTLGDSLPDKLEGWQLPSSEFEHTGVTVARLLSHTAGISQPSLAGHWPDEELPDLVEELSEHVRVIATPGSTYEYSGGGYAILQLLVEEASDQPFQKFVEDRVFAPLGMTATTFDQGAAERAATPHQGVATEDNTNRLQPMRPRLFTAVAGAGMYTNARDMGRFLAAHCTGPKGSKPGRGVLAEDTLAQMWQPDPVAKKYGLGYEVPPPAGPYAVVMHSGSNWGWKANFMVLPEAGLGIAVMTNSNPGSARMAVMRKFRDLVKAKLRGR